MSELVGGLTMAEIATRYETDAFGNPLLDADEKPIPRKVAAETAIATAEPESAPKAHRAPRGPQPDEPWAHQPGCTNPVSDDWNCACGPEVITD